MPRVVPDQKEKFENDELFRLLSSESEIRYTGYRDRPLSERREKFFSECGDGNANIVFINSGVNLQLALHQSNLETERLHRSGEFTSEIDRLPTVHDREDISLSTTRERIADFSAEFGKVHLKSHFIMNGVCVVLRGHVDLDTLNGTGRLEYDEQRAREEDKLLREQIEQYSRRMRELDIRYRSGSGGYLEERGRRLGDYEAETDRLIVNHKSPNASNISSD